jgi:hypothetical protein
MQRTCNKCIIGEVATAWHAFEHLQEGQVWGWATGIGTKLLTVCISSCLQLSFWPCEL